METNLSWSKGNSKLKKLKTIAFDIPAYRSKSGFVTCPGAGACAAVCYAQQRTFTWGLKKNSMERNLASSRQADFVEQACADLARTKAETVRIHASGDFYSQEYLDKWAEIARRNPDKLFYCYTKSHKLDFSKLTGNFKVTQSLGGKWDSLVNLAKPHSRIFSTDADRKRAGYQDGNVNDSLAIAGALKQGLTYHGQRNLTVAQKRYFA